MNSDFAGGTGRCVTHPDSLAGGTCTRCGNFLCYVDTEGGRFTTCEACRLRTGVLGAFPLNRSTYNFGSLFAYCWSAFKTHWLMLSVGMLIPIIAFAVLYVVIYGAVIAFVLGGKEFSWLRDGSLTTKVLTGIGGGAVTVVMLTAVGTLIVGFFRICNDVLDGGQPDIGRMFSVFNRMGRTLVVWFVLMVGSYVAAGVAVRYGGV